MIPLFAYKKLYRSLREQRQAEDLLRDLLAETLEQQYIREGRDGTWNPVRYAQKNFFSILFLALYRAIGIPEERRLWYGAVNHCLRGIVTGADNLLDNEYKEMLPLNFPPAATRFKSIMHILVFDRFLIKLADRMHRLGFDCAPGLLHDALFRAIVPIGAEEAREEAGVATILSPGEILSSVHMYKGGKLLCLSFVAPQLLEKALAPALLKAEQGIYSIGLALQVIDDITDLYEDIKAENHNYLVSAIHHGGKTDEKSRLVQTLMNKSGQGKPVEVLFPDSVLRVMGDAIGEALHGFALLEEAGFWFDQKQAFQLIRHLFELRGLPHLLAFFPELRAVTGSLSHAR